MSAPGGIADVAPSSFVDVNYRSIDGVDSLYSLDSEVVDPASNKFNDTFKVSHSSNVHVAKKTIFNYNEDCIDLCRVHDSSFEADLYPGGRNGLTVKGASTGISAKLRYFGHGTQCDAEIGQFDNYWYPGRLPTRDIALIVENRDTTKPIVVLVWDADQISITVTPAAQNALVVKRYPKWIWYPYFLFRYASLRIENLVRRVRKQPLIKTS